VYFCIEILKIDMIEFLYGKNSKGEEVLLTKDHIKPKSLGGKNHHSNYQTMCVDCNVEKASKYD
jgi:5-methylcytosine-specific restriction endonuclease McrA